VRPRTRTLRGFGGVALSAGEKAPSFHSRKSAPPPAAVTLHAQWRARSVPVARSLAEKRPRAQLQPLGTPCCNLDGTARGNLLSPRKCPRAGASRLVTRRAGTKWRRRASALTRCGAEATCVPFRESLESRMPEHMQRAASVSMQRNISVRPSTCGTQTHAKYGIVHLQHVGSP